MSSNNRYPSLSKLVELERWASDQVMYHTYHYPEAYYPTHLDRFCDWVVGLVNRHPDAVVQRRLVEHCWYRPQEQEQYCGLCLYPLDACYCDWGDPAPGYMHLDGHTSEHPCSGEDCYCQSQCTGCLHWNGSRWGCESQVGCLDG